MGKERGACRWGRRRADCVEFVGVLRRAAAARGYGGRLWPNCLPEWREEVVSVFGTEMKGAAGFARVGSVTGQQRWQAERGGSDKWSGRSWLRPWTGRRRIGLRRWGLVEVSGQGRVGRTRRSQVGLK
ncbi:uncharacterized protein A4U43_C04F15340 [Asparagus officinalis]|uniref:Uncharacterized protein n=1 Tax=Asparagus officinalis TaxID=4686 RepID=A0A5P1F118_ASPOF|nr:uncharacterized protein A4U43_C04F15340 [Asparagus officinalis]